MLNTDKKSDVIFDLENRTGLPRSSVTLFLAALSESVMDNIEASEKYNLGDLGKLVFKQTSEREGRNPATGEKMTIAAKKSFSLRLSKKTKDTLNS